MAQLVAEGRRAHDVELAMLKIGLARDLENLKSISAERDDLLAFKLSCEGLPEQVALIKGEIENLERAMEETKESLAARRARAREVKQAKQDLVGSYRASANHMKKKLLAFSDDFDCGLKKVYLQRPDFPVELVPKAFLSTKSPTWSWRCLTFALKRRDMPCF